MKNFSLSKYLFLTFLFSFIMVNYLLAQEVETLAIITEHQGSNGGIAVDEEGNVYTAHFGGSTIAKVFPDGTYEIFATGFKTPSGNAFDSQGNLYQSNYADQNNQAAPDNIDMIDPNGIKTTFATGLNGPVGITIDPDDNLYVCGCNTNVVLKIDQSGNAQTFSSHPEFACPNGIIFDDSGNLFMVNWANGKLFKITPDGTAVLFATIPGGGNGHIGFQDGFFYISSRLGHQIFKMDQSGNVELFAGTRNQGSADGPLLEASFNRPNACTISHDGEFIYTNGFDFRVRKVAINPPATAVDNSLNPVNLDLRSIYPNPSVGKINIVLEAKKSMEASLVISDVTGLRLQTKLVHLKVGENNISWDIKNQVDLSIPSGVYFLKVIVGDKFLTEKLIIENRN